MLNFEAIFETPGFGGIVALVAISSLVFCYGLTLRWIARGQGDETEAR